MRRWDVLNAQTRGIVGIKLRTILNSKKQGTPLDQKWRTYSQSKREPLSGPNLGHPWQKNGLHLGTKDGEQIRVIDDVEPIESKKEKLDFIF